MKSRAMVLEAFNEPLRMHEIEVPEPGEGWVLVKMLAAGVCGSDVHMWKGEDPRTPLPLTLGHEGVGEIVSIGGTRMTADGRSLSPGDRIAWNRGMVCGKCHYCADLNKPFLCENRSVFGISIPFDEGPRLNGCYAEHIMLRPETDIFLAADIDPAVLVPASCSGGTAAHAFDYIEADLSGKTIVVQGPGPLGAFAVAFAAARNAENIVVIGGSKGRLKICEGLGATTLLNRRETSLEERREAVLELTAGRGADYVVEAAGANGAVVEGVKLLIKGGSFISTGYSQPAGTESLDFFRDIVSRNITIQGIWVSATAHVKSAIDLVSANPDAFAALVSHRFPLEQANEALEVMRERIAIKAVLEMTA